LNKVNINKTTTIISAKGGAKKITKDTSYSMSNMKTVLANTQTY